jgi:hypothetical protein
MARYLLIGVFLAAGLLIAAISYSVRREYRTEDLDMVRLRQQVQPMRRLGYHDLLPAGDPQTWTGVLLDAGCPTREAFRPGQPSPERSDPQAPDVPARPGGAAANAPREAAQTAAGEQTPGQGDTAPGDVLRLMVPDALGRQMDMSCAITGNTRGFAVWLPDGQVKRFDEGGNTRAITAFQGTTVGQAVLSGQAQGVHPRAEVSGRVQGDRIIVDAIRIL